MTNQEFAVLIVDDQPDVVSGVRRILRLDGYRVDSAASIAEMLSRDNWSDYLAILVDRRLPDGTIDSILPQLTGLAPDAAIIVVTAYVDLDGAMAALHHGVEDFLLKPIDPAHLRARLRRLANQRRAEAELIHERAFAQMILDTTRALILVLDRDGRVLRINRNFEELCGYQVAELVGKPVIETLIPEANAAIAEHDLALAYRETYTQETHHSIRTKTGAIREIAWWTAPLKDEQGEIVQLVCAGRDMTVRKSRCTLLGESMMHILWGKLMAAAGLFMLACGTMKREFIIYRLMVARSRIHWGKGDAVHRF